MEEGETFTHVLRLILVLTRISTLQKFPIDAAIFTIDRVFVRVRQ